MIDESNIDALLSARPLPFVEKAKRLLVHMADESGFLGKALDLTSDRLDAMLQALDHGDVDFVADFLEQNGWLKKFSMTTWEVTGAGHLKADELRRATAASMQGFVAMWIDPSMNEAWEKGLQRGIVNAGYNARRIDKKEHANKICDELISEIRRSRFVVTDYTGHRGGVYYEGGYAAGRELPVILTCRKDEMKGLHFDIRQYNCIDWETSDELAQRLQARIEALIGEGPLKRAAR